MNTTENNRLIAEFISIENPHHKGHYTCPDGIAHTPETMRFDRDWNWLMPVVGKLSNQCEEPEELDNLRMCLLCNDIEGAYSEVVGLIENL